MLLSIGLPEPKMDQEITKINSMMDHCDEPTLTGNIL